MGIFDGVLICSDWDGTLCSGSIPESNIAAIRYFQENGGRFTVCSGRYYTYIEKFADKIKPNTYLISLNGALIVDPEDHSILYEGTISRAVFDLVDEFASVEGAFEIVSVYPEGFDGGITLTPQQYREKREELVQRKLYKAVFATDSPKKAVHIRDTVNDRGVDDLVSLRSWDVGVEILGRENLKGAAVLRVADAIGARLVITAGDFENDISMLESADIGYAVANATDQVKAVADRLTVSVGDGAIAAIIYELEKELTM